MKKPEIDPEEMCDVTLFKQMKYKECIRVGKEALKKGYQVKIGMLGFLEKGNNFPVK